MIKQCKNCEHCDSIIGKEVYCEIKGTLLMKNDTDDIYIVLIAKKFIKHQNQANLKHLNHSYINVKIVPID